MNCRKKRVSPFKKNLCKTIHLLAFLTAVESCFCSSDETRQQPFSSFFSLSSLVPKTSFKQQRRHKETISAAGTSFPKCAAAKKKISLAHFSQQRLHLTEFQCKLHFCQTLRPLDRTNHIPWIPRFVEKNFQ